MLPFTQPGQGQGNECQGEVPGENWQATGIAKHWYRVSREATASAQRFLRPWTQWRGWLGQISDHTTVKVWTRNFQRFLLSLSTCPTYCLFIFVTNSGCPLLGSQYKGEMDTEDSPAKAHQDSQRTEASLLEGKADRAGTAQPGEEKA